MTVTVDVEALQLFDVVVAPSQPTQLLEVIKEPVGVGGQVSVRGVLVDETGAVIGAPNSKTIRTFLVARGHQLCVVNRRPVTEQVLLPNQAGPGWSMLGDDDAGEQVVAGGVNQPPPTEKLKVPPLGPDHPIPLADEGAVARRRIRFGRWEWRTIVHGATRYGHAFTRSGADMKAANAMVELQRKRAQR